MITLKETYENVNLYPNEFTDIACTIAFETGLFGLQLSTTTPEIRNILSLYTSVLQFVRENCNKPVQK